VSASEISVGQSVPVLFRLCANSLVSSSSQILASFLRLAADEKSSIAAATSRSVPWKSPEDELDAVQPAAATARSRAMRATARRDIESADQTTHPHTIEPCSATPPLLAVGTRRLWR
jgi:hypothetical protein